MKDKTKVYLSFSRECTEWRKALFLDMLNDSFPEIEAHAFMGGNYNRERLFEDVDLVVIVSWDFPSTRNPQLMFGSRGVCEEARYAAERGIPTVCITGGYAQQYNLEDMTVSMFESYEPYHTETWDGKYGKIKVKRPDSTLKTVLESAVDFTLGRRAKYKPAVKSEAVQTKVMLASAKYLNLI